MSKLKILVVEDDMLIGPLLVEILEYMGHSCSLETTESGAVAAVYRARPNLMIVDVGLRTGDGVSAIKAVLLTGHMPHVLISGQTAQLEAIMPGAIFLQKPFREAHLVRAIERAIGTQPPTDSLG